MILEKQKTLEQLKKEVDHLLSNKSDNAKEKLSTSHAYLQEEFLAELFRGNGWTVAFYGDKKKALLLSDPARPDVILLLIRFVFNNQELSYQQAREELIMFENVLSPLFGCSQYCLIATNGFEAKAEKLEDFNMLLQDWSYVDELNENYSRDKIKEPKIQLFAHNKKTYKNVQKLLQNQLSVAVVQATGTGKSYLIAKLLQDFTGKRRLVMAPSNYIIDQIKEHIQWESDKIEFMTYSKSMFLTESEIFALKPGLIVLDEYHRCGAEEWGRGVQNILNAYHDAVKFGTTATPIRYLDNSRDMSVELFNGNVAENLNLAQAIVRNILPMPKYVCALYSVAEEVVKMRKRIDNSYQNEAVKKQLQLEMDAFDIDWERSYGIPKIFKKHLTKDMRKFIVFCKDEAHLLEMEDMVTKWFMEVNEKRNVNIYRVYDSEAKSDENLEAFRQHTTDENYHLLFSINMLNEGLHVNDVHGVILLRPTESPNIFYQQIGRCLKVGLGHEPVIFDLVNNFKSIRTNDFLYDLEHARLLLLNKREEEGLESNCPAFTVNDEVREITELFGEIKFKLNTWDDLYRELTVFYKDNKHSRPTPANCNNKRLLNWVADQRKRYGEGYLNAERIEKLNDIKFDWSVLDNLWENSFKMLTLFKMTHGHLRIPSKEKRWKIVFDWTNSQRNAYRKNELAPERVKRLEQLGFIWAPIDEHYEVMLGKLKEFYAKHKHTRVTVKADAKLNTWLAGRKYDLKLNRLSPEKIAQLNAVDAKWSVNAAEEDWNNWLLQLLEYKEKHGHCDVSVNHKGYKPLGSWVTAMRMQKRKGDLSLEKVNKLEAAGIRWNPQETKWNECYPMLKEFYLSNGHSNVRMNTGNDMLGSFVSFCRQSRRENILSKEKIELLDEIGFAWDGYSFRWNRRYAELIAFKERFGNCYVPSGFKENKTLANWVQQQIESYEKGTLGNEQIKMLNDVGFEFERHSKIKRQIFKYKKDDTGSEKIAYRVMTKTYEEQLTALLSFHKEHGHINVPAGDTYGNLGTWLQAQRTKYRNGTLKQNLLDDLESLGMDWDPMNSTWNEMVFFLKEFKKEHGHCNITGENTTNKRAINWAGTVRWRKEKGMLTAQKENELDKLEFKWDANYNIKLKWDEKLKELQLYKERHGDLNGRNTGNANDKKMATSINNLRKDYRDNKLSRQRIADLKAIDFIFEPEQEREKEWLLNYEELKKFKSNYGHCRVPAYWKQNLKLALFVAAQRKYFVTKRLNKMHFELLDELGFVWRPNEKKISE